MLTCTVVTRRPLFYSDAKALKSKQLFLCDPSWDGLRIELEEQGDRFFYTINPEVSLTSSTVLKRIRDYLGQNLIHIDWIGPDFEEQYVDCYLESRLELKAGLKRLREILGGKKFIICTKAYNEYTNYESDTQGFVARILLLGLLDREYETLRGPVLEYAAMQAFGGHNCIVATHTHI